MADPTVDPNTAANDVKAAVSWWNSNWFMVAIGAAGLVVGWFVGKL